MYSSSCSSQYVCGSRALVGAVAASCGPISSPHGPCLRVVYLALQRLKSHKVEQEQQDAQEFFLFLVNRVHEEVVALRKAHGLMEVAAAATGGSSSAGARCGRGAASWAIRREAGMRALVSLTAFAACPPDFALSGSYMSQLRALRML